MSNVTYLSDNKPAPRFPSNMPTCIHDEPVARFQLLSQTRSHWNDTTIPPLKIHFDFPLKIKGSLEWCKRKEKWIVYLGATGYDLTENSIITGDIGKDRLISIILLIAKYSIYTAKIKDKIANFFSFKCFIKATIYAGKLTSIHQE